MKLRQSLKDFKTFNLSQHLCTLVLVKLLIVLKGHHVYYKSSYFEDQTGMILKFTNTLVTAYISHAMRIRKVIN